MNRAQDGTLAGSWINFMESGRDWSFSKDMEVAIEKLTVKDVNAAIRRIADPSKMTFVLAADLAKAREAVAPCRARRHQAPRRSGASSGALSFLNAPRRHKMSDCSAKSARNPRLGEAGRNGGKDGEMRGIR